MAKPNSLQLADGIYAALLTPRRPRTTEADAAALLDYLDHVIGAGVKGIVLFGSTGEFVHFDPSDRSRAASLAIKRSRVPTLVNVSHSTLTGTITLAENAIKVGASGILLMPPYFYRYSEADIYAFYEQVCSILDGQIPIYLYNLPVFTNPLSFALISKLLQLNGIAGIKDSSGDPHLLHELAALRREQSFQLLAGNENLFTAARNVGSDGAVSGLSAAVPELVLALDQAISQRDEVRTAQLDARLGEFVGWVESLPPVLAIREAAAFRGWIKNDPALPVSPDTQIKIGELRSWLSSWLPATLSECAAVSVAS